MVSMIIAHGEANEKRNAPKEHQRGVHWLGGVCWPPLSYQTSCRDQLGRDILQSQQSSFSNIKDAASSTATDDIWLRSRGIASLFLVRGGVPARESKDIKTQVPDQECRPELRTVQAHRIFGPVR